MRLTNEISRRTFSLCLAFPILASQRQEQFVIRDNVDLVLLDVSVLDRQRAYVTDLDQRDFRITVDKHWQDISSFSRVDAPVTLGLIVDSSGSMRTKRPEVVMAGLAFARQSNPRDEFFVVNFNNQATLGLPATLPFTDRIEVLRQALFMGEPRGQTALYDAVACGLRHLESGHHEKRTLIVVSDGGDNVSEITEPEVLRLIDESRATIFTIGLVDPEDQDLRPGILKQFANISGGRYFQPGRIEDVVEVMRTIAEDIRHRYTIGFTPKDVDTRRTKHGIKIIAIRGGLKLTVRSRTTYSSEASSGIGRSSNVG